MTTIREIGPSGEYPNKELMVVAGSIALSYIKESLSQLHIAVSKGIGRNVVGSVIGRPEDEEIGIDKIGENVITAIIKRENLPLQVYSEHADPFIGPMEGARLRAALDPFDNSSEYKRGLPTPVFTCMSLYDLDSNPLAGVIANLETNKVYLSIEGKNYVIDDFLKGTPPRRIVKSERKSIRDEGATIAMYTGSNQYSRLINPQFRDMIDSMHIKGRTFANGGAFIYGPLAEGAVDAYVMPREPREEIDAGFAAAHFANMTSVIIHKDGGREAYGFDPSKYREEVNLFVCASTPELAEEIIYFQNKAS